MTIKVIFSSIFKLITNRKLTKMDTCISHRNYRAKINDPLLRRLYESIECARIFNTRYMLDNVTFKLSGQEGRLALAIACRISDERHKIRLTIFDWLLKEGCNFNIKDSDGLTLISYLCKSYNMQLFTYFHKHYKMDIKYDILDPNNDSTLMHAVRTGDLEIVTLLLETIVQFGLSVDVRNRVGLTPYAEALRLNLKDIADILVLKGSASTNVSTIPYYENGSEPDTAVLPTSRFNPRINHPGSLFRCNTKINTKIKEKPKHCPNVTKSETCVKKRHRRRRKPPKKSRITVSTELNNNRETISHNNTPKSVSINNYTQNIVSTTKYVKKRSVTFDNIPEMTDLSIKETSDSKTSNRTEQYINKRFSGKLNSRRKTSKDTIQIIVSKENDEVLLEQEEFFPKQDSPESFQASTDIDDMQYLRQPRLLSAKPRTASALKFKESIKKMAGKTDVIKRSRKGISSCSSLSSLEPFDCIEQLYFQNKMEQLMVYKLRPRDHKRITYKDVKELLPNDKEIGPELTSFSNLRWLLLLKAEQNQDSFLNVLPVSSADNNPSDIQRNKPKLSFDCSTIPKITPKRKASLMNAAMNRILTTN